MKQQSRPGARLEVTKLELSLAFWLGLFVFGGGLLALYYAGISYFPEVSWQDALTYMALMAMIGGSLLLAYSFLLFVPGAIWSEVLVFDEQLQDVLTMSGRQAEPCVKSIVERLLAPFAVFMATAHFLFYLVDARRWFAGWAAAVAAFISLLAVSAWLVAELHDGLLAASGNAPLSRLPPTPRSLGPGSGYRWGTSHYSVSSSSSPSGSSIPAPQPFGSLRCFRS